MLDEEHKRGCPRLQSWDAGEWDAPCLCNSLQCRMNDLKDKWNYFIATLIFEFELLYKRIIKW
jgi:hypothetical protein